MGTTTIEITDEQKEQMDAIKQFDNESYKSVQGRLIDAYNTTHETTDNTADYDEFIETMQRIESSTQTTEERTNQIQRQLEEMKR